MTTSSVDLRDVIARHVRAPEAMTGRPPTGIGHDPASPAFKALCAKLDERIEAALAEIDARAGAGQLRVDWPAFDGLVADTVRHLADHALAATAGDCPPARRARRALRRGGDVVPALTNLLRWCEGQEFGPGSCPRLQLQGWALIIVQDVLGKTRPACDSENVGTISRAAASRF